MNLEYGAKQNTGSARQHYETDTQLHGRRLILARVIWLALVIPSLGLFIMADILYVPRIIGSDRALRTLMLRPVASFNGYIASYSHLYPQFGSYLTLIVIFASLASLVWIAVGLVVFWRKSDDRMGLLAAFGLIMYGVAMSPLMYLLGISSETHGLWKWPVIFEGLLGWGSLGLIIMLFPNGRFVPRGARWGGLVYLGFLVAWGLPANVPFSTVQWHQLYPWMTLGFFLAPVYIQLYRYWHPSSLIERQQTRLVVFAIVLTMVTDLGFASSLGKGVLIQLGLTSSTLEFLSTDLYAIGMYLFPLAIGIAILRYRLWDIDILINRTLVYGTLTLLLAAVYAGLVVGLQALLRGLISQNNNVAIVVSTLVIAALFMPLRQVIQRLIDRRFYRQKYDAERTLAAFGETLRNEAGLDQLRADLVAVIMETMQPTFVSLWVRPPEQDENHRSKEMRYWAEQVNHPSVRSDSVP